MDAILKEIVVSEISSSHTGFRLDKEIEEVEESDEGETTMPGTIKHGSGYLKEGGVTFGNNELSETANINENPILPLQQEAYIPEEGCVLPQQNLFPPLSSNVMTEQECSYSELNQQRQLQLQQLLEKATMISHHLTIDKTKEMNGSFSRTSAHQNVDELSVEEESQLLQVRSDYALFIEAF